MYIYYVIVVDLWKHMTDYFSLCKITSKYFMKENRNLTTYFVIPDSDKYIPKIQYILIKNDIKKEIIVNLHFTVSKFFSKRENQYINKLFTNNNISMFCYDKLFSVFINDIYIPSNRISSKVKKYIKFVKKNYLIGIHIRTGIKADFKEHAPWFGGNNSTNSIVETALNISSSHSNSRWIICGDSTKLIHMIESKFKKYSLKYKEYFNYPKLLRHSKDYILKEYNIYASSVLIEIELLSKCDYLILSQGSMISRISLLRNKNFKNKQLEYAYINKNTDFRKS